MVSAPKLLVHGAAPSLVALYQRAEPSGHRVEFVDTPEMAVELASTQGCEALVLHVEDAAPEVIAGLPRELAERVVLVLDHPTEQRVLDLIRFDAVGTTIIKNGALGLEELQVMLAKQVRRDLSGVEKYLAFGTEVHRVQLTDSTRRGEAIDVFERFLAARKLAPRRLGQLLTIADEYITNAFYNAPVDEHGRRPFVHLSRIDPVHCATDHPIDVSYAHDGHLAGVAVRDVYGTLTRATVLQHMARSFGRPEVSFAGAGAGLGLYTAYRSASQVVFNLLPGHYTECIGLVDIGGSYRDFIAQGNSVHIFQLPLHGGPRP